MVSGLIVLTIRPGTPVSAARNDLYPLTVIDPQLSQFRDGSQRRVQGTAAPEIQFVCLIA